MEKQNSDRMGSAPMLGLILTMSLPVMFSMLVQALYNIVDSMFVSRLGETALTAVSLAYPISNLIMAVAVGTGVGINSLIARRLGEKQQEQANQAASHALLLGLLSGLAFAVVGLLGTNFFYRCFTDDATVIALGSDYVYVITLFSFGCTTHICLEKVLQATGNMAIPMFMQLLGAVTNLILDPIMIFGLFGCPAMGVKGAAIATVTGQIASMVGTVLVLALRPHAVQIKLRGFRPNRKVLADIYSVGLPSMVMQSISSVLTTALNAMLMSFSGAAVSVFAIFNRTESFAFMPVFGLNQGLMPILGYNYGAKNKKRLLDCLRYGLIIAITILTAGMVVFLVWPDAILNIFNASPEMMRIGLVALRRMALCFPFAGFGIILSTFFQALGQGSYSLYISVLRQLVLILPAAWIFSALFGLDALWLSIPFAEGFSMVAAIYLYRRIYQKKVAHLEEEEPSAQVIVKEVTAD